MILGTNTLAEKPYKLSPVSGSEVTVVDDSSHNGFPGFAVMDNGNYLVVYRVGTNHAPSKGDIYKRESNDGGATWGGATLVYSHGSLDSRDPSVFVTSTGRVVLSFFLADAVTGAHQTDGVRVIYSDDNAGSWSGAYTVNSAFTSTCACSCRAFEIPGGDLILGLCGINAGETNRNCSVVFSSDDGATWGSEVLVADGDTLGIDAVEPNIVYSTVQTDLLCLIRAEDRLDIFSCRSGDSGATWSTPIKAFDGYGSPRVVELSQGIFSGDEGLICVYRSAGNDLAVYRYSYDGGIVWTNEILLDGVGYDVMAYAALEDLGSNLIGIAWGEEVSITNCDLNYLELLGY